MMNDQDKRAVEGMARWEIAEMQSRTLSAAVLMQGRCKVESSRCI